MYSITIALANTQIVWTFIYKTKESAEGEMLNIKSVSANPIEFSDDFGQTASILRSSIAGVLFEDLEQSKLAHVERAMHNERVKILANRTAMADPMIKTAMMTRNQGPAIYNPVGNGGHG